MPPDGIRLSKFLADAGVASRRKADLLIESGRVSVNSKRVLEPFFRVNPDKDAVTIDNSEVKHTPSLRYIALYKPVGYLSDLADSQGTRKLARSLLGDKERLFPVGRLDYHSEGLMLFTNDGQFALRVMHPRYEVQKEYLVKLKGKLQPEEVDRALHGIIIEGERYAFDSLALARTEKQNSWYRVIVHEGKNRVIRKVADALSHPVMRLRRTRIGPIQLGNMAPGEHRHLTAREIAYFAGK